MSRQPPIFTSSEAEAGRQRSSSPSGSGPAVSPSFVSAPSGFRQVLFGSVPTSAQYSKCPISSENALLYVCAAVTLRVAGVEVLHSGWKSYGFTVHVVALGSNTTLPNPFSALAVMEPVVCLVRSLMTTRTPRAVSDNRTLRLSPGFIRKSCARSGEKCSVCSGFAGELATPFLVTNAKFTGSGPTELRHEVLLNWPVLAFNEKVSM